MNTGRVLVTGGTGFVGGALLGTVGATTVWQPVAAVRQNPQSHLKISVPYVVVGSIDDGTDWFAALQGVSVVIHTAARVHVMHDQSPDPLAEFRRVNVAGTLNLARQAAAAGVKRLVFVSSVKVNGEATLPGQVFKADDIHVPTDPYGLSKYEAEAGLRAVAAETGLEVAIVRPPLVYGPGVKANFAAMVRWLSRGVPLPLRAVVHNRRSLVALDNLVDLLLVCATHPAAANQTFMASDGDDMSTADLLRRIGVALGKPARLLPVPVSWLKLGAAVVGKADVAQRLLGSLQVDISKNQQLLGWTPPVSVDAALKQVAAGFR